MSQNTPKSFQNRMRNQLSKIYTDVDTEWSAFKNEPRCYSPKIDIAVGPFAIEQKYIEKYDELMDSSQLFIEQLLQHHQQNVRCYSTRNMWNNQEAIPSFEDLKEFNQNARCLLAIEIENKVSRKHLLGGAVNAAALGRIGIVVGWTEDKVKALVKLKAYWDFLGSVRKNTFKTNNLIILRPEQLSESINNFLRS